MCSYPSHADHIPKELLQYYQRLLASQPARRLNPKQLLEAGVLKNRLAEATSFLENLALKDSMEKVMARWSMVDVMRQPYISYLQKHGWALPQHGRNWPFTQGLPAWARNLQPDQLPRSASM